MTNLRVFGLNQSVDYALEVIELMNGWRDYDVSHEHAVYNRHHEERRPDGEAYLTALDNVRGCDVFVISSLYGDEVETVDEKFMKTSIFINTLRHASASRITLVAPYLCYMRQDRKTESRAPITTQAVAMMLESVGLDRLLTMDVHNLGAEQNAFRIPIDNLEARKLLADSIAYDVRQEGIGYTPKWSVLTPDAGGISRTKLMQQSLAKRLKCPIDIIYADKSRISAEEVKIKLIGNVYGRNIIVVDDMISTGGTIDELRQEVQKEGGNLWGVAATHGLFVNGAPDKLMGIPRIYTTDTVAPFRLAGSVTKNSLKVVSTANMFGEAIRRIHLEGGSISELLDD